MSSPLVGDVFVASVVVVAISLYFVCFADIDGYVFGWIRTDGISDIYNRENETGSMKSGIVIPGSGLVKLS